MTTDPSTTATYCRLLSCVDDWLKVLAALPESPTKADRRQRQAVKTGLTVAQSALEEMTK